MSMSEQNEQNGHGPPAGGKEVLAWLLSRGWKVCPLAQRPSPDRMFYRGSLEGRYFKDQNDPRGTRDVLERRSNADGTSRMVKVGTETVYTTVYEGPAEVVDVQTAVRKQQLEDLAQPEKAG
jgi:hypothetical protein